MSLTIYGNLKLQRSERCCANRRCNCKLVRRPDESEEAFARRTLCIGCQEYARGEGAFREYAAQKARESWQRRNPGTEAA